MNMRFNVDNLHEKSTDEVREIFSTISSINNCIILHGDFHVGLFSSSHAKILAYLPKHVSSVTFEVKQRYKPNSHIGTSKCSVAGGSSHFTTNGTTGSSFTLEDSMEIGSTFKEYIASLPPSIHSVKFVYIPSKQDKCAKNKSFLENFSEGNLLCGLPPTVKYLDLGDLPLVIGAGSAGYIFQPYMVSRLLKNVPATVQRLDTRIFFKEAMYAKMHVNNNIDYDFSRVLSAITSFSGTELGLAHNRLDKLRSNCFNVFFSCFPQQLKMLDFSDNELYKKPPNELDLFLSGISKTLEKLMLCRNQLSAVDAGQLTKALLKLSVSDLDIGENGLLLLGVDEFAMMMDRLPKTVTSLRICEKDGKQPAQELNARLRFYPPHLRILDFSNSNLSGLSVQVFVESVLANLPESIEGLDLSSNDLFRRPVKDLFYLFSHLPPQIRILKLNDNGLGCMKMEDLRIILPAVSRWVSELHVFRNGFDRLPYKQMSEVMTLLPGTVTCLFTEINEHSEEQMKEKTEKEKSDNPDGNSGLHLVVDREDKEMVITLLSDGHHSVMEKNKNDKTPIDLAAEYWHGKGYDIFFRLSRRAQQEIQKVQLVSDSGVNGVENIIYKYDLLVYLATNLTKPLLERLKEYSDEKIEWKFSDGARELFSEWYSTTRRRNHEQAEIYKALYHAEESKNYPVLLDKLESLNKNPDSPLYGLFSDLIKNSKEVLDNNKEKFRNQLGSFTIEKFRKIEKRECKLGSYEPDMTSLNEKLIQSEYERKRDKIKYEKNNNKNQHENTKQPNHQIGKKVIEIEDLKEDKKKLESIIENQDRRIERLEEDKKEQDRKREKLDNTIEKLMESINFLMKAHEEKSVNSNAIEMPSIEKSKSSDGLIGSLSIFSNDEKKLSSEQSTGFIQIGNKGVL